jgi:hypothetical protein
MEFLENLSKILYYYSSPLNIKFDKSYNLQEFIFKDLTIQTTIDIFLKNFIIKFLEKNCENIQNNIFLVSFMIIIFQELEYAEKMLKVERKIIFMEIQKLLFNILDKKHKEMIDKLNFSQLENFTMEEFLKNSHLFSEEEIVILPIVLLKTILNFEDFLEAKIIVSSIDVLTEQYYTLYDGLLLQNNNDNDIKNTEKFHSILLSPNIQEYLVDNKEKEEFLQSFFDFIVSSKIEIIFSMYKLNDDIKHMLKLRKIKIYDRLRKENIDILKDQLSLSSLCAEDIILNRVIQPQSYTFLEIENLNLKSKSPYNLVKSKRIQTFCINQLSPILDNERKKITNDIIIKILKQIMLCIDQNCEEREEYLRCLVISFEDIYNYFMVFVNSEDGYNKKEIIEVIKNILLKCDSLIYFNFTNILEEVTVKLRSHIMIKTNDIQEVFDFIKFIIYT